jgi:hypothetical protein
MNLQDTIATVEAAPEGTNFSLDRESFLSLLRGIVSIDAGRSKVADAAIDRHEEVTRLHAELSQIKEAVQHIIKFEGPRLPASVVSKLSEVINRETKCLTTLD